MQSDLYEINFNERGSDGKKIWRENGMNKNDTIHKQCSDWLNVKALEASSREQRELQIEQAMPDKAKLLEFCKAVHDVPKPKLTDPGAKLLWDIFFDKFATLVNDLGRDAGKL